VAIMRLSRVLQIILVLILLVYGGSFIMNTFRYDYDYIVALIGVGYVLAAIFVIIKPSLGSILSIIPAGFVVIMTYDLFFLEEFIVEILIIILGLALFLTIRYEGKLHVEPRPISPSLQSYNQQQYPPPSPQQYQQPYQSSNPETENQDQGTERDGSEIHIEKGYVWKDYFQNRDQLFDCAVQSITELGYKLLKIDKESGLISCETGMSFRTWRGQNMSVVFIENKEKTRIQISGVMKQTGIIPQVYDWGESKKIGRKIFEKIDANIS